VVLILRDPSILERNRTLDLGRLHRLLRINKGLLPAMINFLFPLHVGVETSARLLYLRAVHGPILDRFNNSLEVSRVQNVAIG